MKWSEERQEVISISRGGKEYDIPTTHIRTNPLVMKYLNTFNSP